MPINFPLETFRKVSDVFCETGTYHGDAIIKAFDAGFKKISTIEISPINQKIAQDRFLQHTKHNKKIVSNFILGDAEDKISELVDFALSYNDNHPIFWLDAHTHYFENGEKTPGSACPLITEIREINSKFHGQAIVLIDDLRIISSLEKSSQKNLRFRIKAALTSLFNPEKLSELDSNWGSEVNLYHVLRECVCESGVSFTFLDGIVPNDILCIYPPTLHNLLFQEK